MFDFYFSFINK